MGQPGPFDMRPAVADERNYFLANEYGGFLFAHMGDGVYEIHTQFLPEGRGKKAKRAADEAREFMFTQTDCQVLRTVCPHPESARLAQWGGMKKTGMAEVFGQPVEVYELKRSDWICQ